jgi:lipoyl(octanoyl) transferase
MTTWRFLDSGPAEGARNMLVDEGLLREAAAGKAQPVLRFYTWSPPAVSLGRFQDEATSVNAAACRERGIDIVRRITGGRAVLHDRELTYSVIAPAGGGLFPDDVLGTYKMIAAALLAGLHNLGIAAEMVSRSGRHADRVLPHTKEPACFASPSWYEILARDRKIIGSAQRRVPGAFLQHGSILIGYDPGLEAAVIPGGGPNDAVTCISQELGKEVSMEQVKDAIKRGFSSVLSVDFA